MTAVSVTIKYRSFATKYILTCHLYNTIITFTGKCILLQFICTAGVRSAAISLILACVRIKSMLFDKYSTHLFCHQIEEILQLFFICSKSQEMLFICTRSQPVIQCT